MKKLSIILVSAFLLNSLAANENLKLLASAALYGVGTHIIVKGIEKKFPLSPLSHKCATLAFFAGTLMTNLSLYSAGINFASGNNNASQWPFLVPFAAGAAALSTYKYYYARPFERINSIPLNLVFQPREPVGLALAVQERIRTLEDRVVTLLEVSRNLTRHFPLQIDIRLDDEVHASYEPGASAASGFSGIDGIAADEALIIRQDTRRLELLAGADRASSASAL